MRRWAHRGGGGSQGGDHAWRLHLPFDVQVIGREIELARAYRAERLDARVVADDHVHVVPRRDDAADLGVGAHPQAVQVGDVRLRTDVE